MQISEKIVCQMGIPHLHIKMRPIEYTTEYFLTPLEGVITTVSILRHVLLTEELLSFYYIECIWASAGICQNKSFICALPELKRYIISVCELIFRSCT